MSDTIKIGEEWMYAKFGLRPLPRHPDFWPTDKLSRVEKRADGLIQLSHPHREPMFLDVNQWEWVLAEKLNPNGE